LGVYCEEIARRLRLSDQICGSIALAAQMHDIGKIAVPDHILLKVGPLTAAERAQMETHTEIGRKILQRIPIEGRIAAVADVFDALTRDRPYPRAMPMAAAQHSLFGTRSAKDLARLLATAHT
jgi:HD-GYP domain-containing protein (c-di-GMP phosphodiesterase class II)